MSENREKALELLRKADEETSYQMFRFLFDEEYIRALIYSKIDMIAYCIEHHVYINAEKELKDFIDFFLEPNERRKV